MPKRSFGPSTDTGAAEAERAEVKRIESSSTSIQPNDSVIKNEKLAKVVDVIKKPYVFFPVVILFIIIIFLIIFVGKCDTGHGAGTPQDAAYNFTVAASKRSEEVWNYLPRFARDAKQGSSDVMWELDDATYVPLESLKYKSMQTIREAIPSIKNGYEAFYHDSPSIKDAVQVTLVGEITANDGNTVSIEFDIVTIKSGWRWYVYTGADLDFVNFPQDVIGEARVPADPTASVELRPYEGAIDDLKLGKVTIDGVNFRMPVKYSNVRNVFTLEDSAIEKKDRELQPNMILKFLPVMYDGAETECFVVDIANPSDESVDLADGYVTTLQARRQSGEKPVAMVLPGNVVFNTSKDDVFAVYGDLELYDGHDNDLNSFEYDPSRIYQVQVEDGNDYNWIYLIFNEDDKLAAVEWRFYDMESILDKN